jgi:hypothetical protein
MKVYFTASISHRKELFKEYKNIISTLKKLGVDEVFSEDILDIGLKSSLSDSKIGLKNWHTTWIKYISDCDFAVAEISYPSTINVGFEIGNIIAHGKPVIGLYKEGKEPIFTSEPRPKRLIKSSYTADNLKDVLSWGIEEVKEIINRRFTFLVPPDINDFLENSYKVYNLTASDLIRNLVRKEMINIKKQDKKINK